MIVVKLNYEPFDYESNGISFGNQKVNCEIRLAYYQKENCEIQ